MNNVNETNFINNAYARNIKNFIEVVQPDTTNMYLYPAMLRIAYAVEQNRGYCYDAFNAELNKIMAVVEYNDSVCAWLFGEKFNLRLINVVGGVPILGKVVSVNIDNDPDNFEGSIRKYNKENNNDIRSYYLIQLA